MKLKFQEQSVLFASLLKWFVIASVIGVVGASTTIFLQALNWSTKALHHWPYYYFLLPVAMFVSILLIKYLCPERKATEQSKSLRPFIRNPAE